MHDYLSRKFKYCRKFSSSLLKKEMERDHHHHHHHHRRSKSASTFEGFCQVHKYRAVSRLPSDSDSYVDPGNRNDTSSEIRQSSSGQATDRPSNILATRIYKETEPKRRSLSSIARLLHRDGLPFLWNTRKQKKKLVDSYRLDNTSIDIEPNRELFDDQPNRISPNKQEESEDVYEDLDTSPYVNGRYSSRWSPSSMLSKSEMALIRQNLKSKRLTYDESVKVKFHGSEELDSSMLDSRELRLFCRKNNSLGKYVYDQRGTSSSSLGSPTVLLNLPISAKHGNATSRRADKDIVGKHITCHQNDDDELLLDHDNRHKARIAHKVSDAQLKEKNKMNILPTPIIVLKSQLEDMQNSHGSSPHQSQGDFTNSTKMTGCPSVESVKELSWRKTKSYYDAEFVMPDEARRLANRITRQLRDACESEGGIQSGLRESLMEETSYGAKESYTDSELGVFKRSSRGSLTDDDKRGSHLSSRSVNEEAKKRLAERWKITRKYRDLEIVGKGITLGEMLSAHDDDKKSKLTAYGRIDRSSTRVGGENGCSSRHGLSVTVSKGSKNKTERPSRSRSVPPIGGSVRGRGTCHDVLANEKHLLHTEPISHGTGKATKQYPSHKDHFSSQCSKFRGKKPHSCLPIFIEEIDSLSDARFEIQMEANVKGLPQQKLMFQMAERDDCNGSDDVSEIVAVDAEHGITTLLPTLLHPNHSSVDSESSRPTADDQNDFRLQEQNQGVSEEVAVSSDYLEAEQVCSESSKDAEYATSISILEAHSVDDASSSSESSKRVSAEVNDLRMQLQLLKMDYSAYDNPSTHIPMEKDSIRAESWEASYTRDLLILAGLEDFGFDLFRIMWHSPYYPLDCRLFDILEEKYCNEIAGSTSRPERKLLFDRINSALSEIFLKHVDTHPWVMPKLPALIHLMWQKERARYTVARMVRQESANRLQVSERILDREMQWSDLADEVAFTGNEVEELLLDDLINEFLLDIQL